MSDDGTSFMVDLSALQDAIGSVSTERDTINDGITQMKATFANVEEHWQGPAGSSFPPLAATFNSAADTLTSLLDEAIGKMQTAHDNYASTEQTNGGNYQSLMVTQGGADTDTTGQGDPAPAAQPGPDTQPLPQPKMVENVETAPVEVDARQG
jgi:WXG100 family type VII secretion target